MNKHLRRISDHVWGPGGSIALHVLILFFLLKWLLSPGIEESRIPEIIVDVSIPANSPDIGQLDQEIQQSQDIPSIVDPIARPDVKPYIEPPLVGPVGPSAQAGPAAVSGTGPSEENPNSFDPSLNILSESPLKLKDIYRDRSYAGRTNALAKYAENGTAIQATEYAVAKSLDWLKAHQYPDGSWGPSYRVAMTGLAILTYLAHNETMSSPEYGDAVRKGLRFLLRSQRDGLFAYGGWGYPGQVQVYEHAIGTYAISEAYGMTSIPLLKVAMESAAQVIIDGQNENGSWCYNYQKGPDAPLDVSVSGWQLQALKAAFAAGAENKGLHAAIESGMRGLKVMMSKEGSGMFRYTSRGEEAKRSPDLCMTGISVLCMQLAGHWQDAEAKAGVKVLQDMQFHWAQGSPDLRRTGGYPLYAWYYITQARFQQGGPTWNKWNRQFALTLAGMQNQDGSWCPAPQSSEAYYGPVYCTTLSALMLQVYYRFLPTYQPVDSQPTKGPEEDNEDITIKFG